MTEKQLLKRIERMDANILKLREVIKNQKDELKESKSQIRRLTKMNKDLMKKTRQVANMLESVLGKGRTVH